MITAELAGVIARHAEGQLRPAAAAALATLETLGLPSSVVDFYRAFEPASCIEINGVRLWPIPQIIEENRDYVPGADLFPHGLVVFATTVFGDVYCFDLSEKGPPVVLMSHELGFSEMPLPRIKELRKQVAPNLDTFLERFAVGALDIEPLSQ